MPHDEPRATLITEALRSLAVGIIGPAGSDHTSWARLDGRLALLADELAIAVDDRPQVCRTCGTAALLPPLPTIAALLRPASPPAPITTDADKVHRLAPVLSALASLLGQCSRHALPGTIIDPTRSPVSDPLAAALDALHAAQLERVALAGRCREAYQRGGLAALLDVFEQFARIASDTDTLADAVLALARRAVEDTGHRA